MQKYKYLNFFDKKGVYCNFDYDETLDKWTGRIDIDVVSEGLIEDYQLFIMEEVYNKEQDQYEFTKPILNSTYIAPYGPESADIILETDYVTSGATSYESYSFSIAKNFTCEFQNDVPIPEFFLYDFNLNKKGESLLEKSNKVSYEIDSVSSYTESPINSTNPGIKILNTIDINANPLQINIGFAPEGEDLFGNFLYIKDAVGHVIAELFVYGESIEEDERLSNLLQSMGYDLLPGDFIIFDEFDVNEIKPDWQLINEKRKELLLEHDNIFPYIGSYKALINIIKFFGYQNLRMKEYWESIDSESTNFGKYKQMDIHDIFTQDANFNTDLTTPNKIYKKTNKFGLYYDLTVESGEYDEDGLPIAKETYIFSPQEALIKIFALKKKLQNYFLGLNSKIVDIIGESIYFAKYELNVWSDQQKIEYIDIGISPTFKVSPSNTGMIEDLRPLLTYGFPIGSDLNMGGYSKLNMWRVGIGDNINTYGPNDSEQTYELNFTIPGPSSITISTTYELDVDTGKFIYTKSEIAEGIIKNIKANNSLNSNFFVYQEGGTSGIIRLVQKSVGGTGTIYSKWYSNTNLSGPGFGKFSIPGSIGGTSNYINISPNETQGPTGSPMSYYGDAILGYFNNANFDIRKINDDEDIAVGCPLVLENTSFNISWDDADVTFNQIDKIDSSTNKILFGKYNRSKTIAGWTSTSQPVYTTISGFPTTKFPSRFTYSWNNLAQYGYYEMQWKVYQGETLIVDSGRDLIEKINRYPIILPYVGKYKVEMHLWDDYNTKSSCIKSDIIEVDSYDVDFIGWYKKLESGVHYRLDSKKQHPQLDNARKIDLGGYFVPNEDSEYLTWDEYVSSWDLPFHPNENMDMADIKFNSLDSLEFYKTIKNPTTNPLVDRFAYKFDLIGNEASLDDLYHLWWDSTGSDITQFNITGITGPTSYIAMTKGNSIYSKNGILYIVDGPTGYTGPIGVTSFIGNTGDIIHSFSNRSNFVFSKGQWRAENEFIDIYRATNLNGTYREKMLELTRQLNMVMPNEDISHPYLKDFIYTFNEEYYTEINQLKLKPYIRSISKSSESKGRHKLKYIGCTGDAKSYNTVNFGYVGDQPLYFEIYNVSPSGPTGSIFISGMTSSYNIGATNLYGLFRELNGSTAQNNPIINKFTYSLITNYPNAISTGIGSTAYYTKIQAISKNYNAPSINIQYDKINGTTYGRSLTKNVSWDEIRILKYNQELPICTTVNFTYDSARMPGKKNPKWILSKEGDSTVQDIYYNNKYFSYMFNKKGSYSLTLELEDTNGNIKTITKKEIIKII